MFIDSLLWQIAGVILFLFVFVVIGLNMTVFADYEEIESNDSSVKSCRYFDGSRNLQNT